MRFCLVSSQFSVFDVMPTSFIIRIGIEDHEYLTFLERFKELENN